MQHFMFLQRITILYCKANFQINIPDTRSQCRLNKKKGINQNKGERLHKHLKYLKAGRIKEKHNHHRVR